MNELNIGEHIYLVKAEAKLDKWILKIKECKSEVKDWVLADRYEDDRGSHELFELLPDRTERDVTGWAENGNGSFIPYKDEKAMSLYDEDDEYVYFEFSMWSPDKDKAKEGVRKEVLQLLDDMKENVETIQKLVKEV